MKIKNNPAIFVALVALMTSTGCVRLWRKSLDVKTYMLEAPRDAAVGSEALADKLWIDNVVVLPPYNVRNFVVRDGDVSFSTSYYSSLLISPSENIQNAAYMWFDDSGIFNRVSLSQRSEMSHRLSLSVVAFYCDRSAPEAQAVLSVKATFFDEKTRDMRVIFSKTYSQSIAVNDLSAESNIRSFNEGLNRILTAVEADVRASF